MAAVNPKPTFKEATLAYPCVADDRNLELEVEVFKVVGHVKFHSFN
jgi:hypothetical protein